MTAANLDSTDKLLRSGIFHWTRETWSRRHWFYMKQCSDGQNCLLLGCWLARCLKIEAPFFTEPKSEILDNDFLSGSKLYYKGQLEVRLQAVFSSARCSCYSKRTVYVKDSIYWTQISPSPVFPHFPSRSETVKFAATSTISFQQV